MSIKSRHQIETIVPRNGNLDWKLTIRALSARFGPNVVSVITRPLFLPRHTSLDTLVQFEEAVFGNSKEGTLGHQARMEL